MKHSDKIKKIWAEVKALQDNTSLLEASVKALAVKVGYMYKVGDKVSLGYAKVGTIDEIFTTPVSMEIDGVKIDRQASDSDPAYLITAADGHKVLRSASEIDNSSRQSS